MELPALTGEGHAAEAPRDADGEGHRGVDQRDREAQGDPGPVGGVQSGSGAGGFTCGYPELTSRRARINEQK